MYGYQNIPIIRLLDIADNVVENEEKINFEEKEFKRLEFKFKELLGRLTSLGIEDSDPQIAEAKQYLKEIEETLGKLGGFRKELEEVKANIKEFGVLDLDRSQMADFKEVFIMFEKEAKSLKGGADLENAKLNFEIYLIKHPDIYKEIKYLVLGTNKDAESIVGSLKPEEQPMLLFYAKYGLLKVFGASIKEVALEKSNPHAYWSKIQN